MPLGKSLAANISELTKDNKRKGVEKGDRGRVRSRAQIIAIAYKAKNKGKRNV